METGNRCSKIWLVVALSIYLNLIFIKASIVLWTFWAGVLSFKKKKKKKEEHISSVSIVSLLSMPLIDWVSNYLFLFSENSQQNTSLIPKRPWQFLCFKFLSSAIACTVLWTPSHRIIIIFHHWWQVLLKDYY